MATLGAVLLRFLHLASRPRPSSEHRRESSTTRADGIVTCRHLVVGNCIRDDSLCHAVLDRFDAGRRHARTNEIVARRGD
jgi:hypothetical protein